MRAGPRAGESGPAELITNDVARHAGPHLVRSEVARVEEPDEVEQVLTKRFGLIGRVSFARRTYHWRNSFVHLDAVEDHRDPDGGLHVIVQTVVGDGSAQAAMREAQAVLSALGIEDRAVAGTYAEQYGVRE